MDMPKEKLNAFSLLLKTLRHNSKRHTCPSALQVEVLLHVAVKPRTYEELAALTNTSNGAISRAITSMAPRVHKGEFIMPNIYLLNRDYDSSKKRFKVSLSTPGKELMKEIGLSSSTGA
tara:strand:+ start:1345 stop:1701 length:357 start_codon:yes stop_codon:yes gene_type:complete